MSSRGSLAAMAIMIKALGFDLVVASKLMKGRLAGIVPVAPFVPLGSEVLLNCERLHLAPGFITTALATLPFSGTLPNMVDIEVDNA